MIYDSVRFGEKSIVAFFKNEKVQKAPKETQYGLQMKK